MNKTQLTVHISNLLKGSIEAYEAVDLCLEDTDIGTLHTIHHCLETATDYLRKARRAGRVLLEEYEENLDKKPEYIDRADLIEDDDGDDGDDGNDDD